MVLYGFSSAQTVGWLAGVLHLQRAKGGGTPVLPPLKSLRNLFLLISYALMSGLWIDFHIRHHAFLRLRSSSPVDRFLSLSLHIGASLFDLYFRLCFLLRAKIVVRFLKALEADAAKGMSHPRRGWKGYILLVRFVHLYLLLGSLGVALWVGVAKSRPHLGILPLPQNIYPAIFFFLAAAPTTFSVFVSFAFVTISALHLRWVFEDFCATFEAQLSAAEEKMLSPMRRDLGEVYPVSGGGGRAAGGDQAVILSKFEHMKMLCGQYDKVGGPLLLGLLVRGVFLLISSATTILLHKDDGGGLEEGERIKGLLNLYTFVTEISQLSLLQLGHIMGKEIAEKKEELHRRVILMTNHAAQDQFKEVILLISEWKWKMSGGPGFFEVDRPLLSGVISSLMTYVTIIFQINVEKFEQFQNTTDITVQNSTRLF